MPSTVGAPLRLGGSSPYRLIIARPMRTSPPPRTHYVAGEGSVVVGKAARSTPSGSTHMDGLADC